MAPLDPRFLNGRDGLDSYIKLTAHWFDGWKLKDNKWKYEEEVKLPHVESAWFRCRVHLYTSLRTSVTPIMAREDLLLTTSPFEKDGVLAQFSGSGLNIIVPLKLDWEETQNESLHPKVFRRIESLRLPVDAYEPSILEILITYRGLSKLYGSKKMFVQNSMRNGYSWQGSSGTALESRNDCLKT